MKHGNGTMADLSLSGLMRAAMRDQEAAVAEARIAALEEAAQVCERDVDWSAFGKANIEQWDGGPDAVRDYRIGLVSARAIAAAIRALKEQEPTT